MGRYTLFHALDCPHVLKPHKDFLFLFLRDSLSNFFFLIEHFPWFISPLWGFPFPKICPCSISKDSSPSQLLSFLMKSTRWDYFQRVGIPFLTWYKRELLSSRRHSLASGAWRTPCGAAGSMLPSVGRQTCPSSVTSLLGWEATWTFCDLGCMATNYQVQLA